MLVPETEIIVTTEGVEILRRTLRPGDYVIGRESSCDVHLDVEMLSRRHAQLIVNYDHVLVEDLGSSNGTFINGKPVTEATRLWPNQKIQVGSATIELRRLKTIPSGDFSLAPQTATVRRILPEEFLREKKYDIGGVVAQGGMGAILDATEATTERTVAMKVMLDGSSPEDLTRFVSEAKVTAQLEHPNIVPVHELGVDENDQIFYTMKFVRGITLKKVLELLAERTAETMAKYPLGTLLTIFQKVGDAVAFAHSKGVIHRDLKPENVMIGDFGEVLLMDWGLAKLIRGTRAVAAQTAGEFSGNGGHQPSDGSASATIAGSILGTPQYMSPEQARGELEELDERTDIYALGAILYHLLALRPPVDGETAMEIVEKVGRGEIEPLQRAGSSSRIIDSLAAVVRKAMGFDKARRYPSVAELQADITAFQNGFATRAEQASVLKQLALLIKRYRGVFATAAAAWLLITVLAVWFVLNLRAKERRAFAGEQSAKAAETVAVQEKEFARRSLARAALNLAEAEQREGNGPAMQNALREVPEDLRDSTWYYLLEQADTSLARIRTSTSDLQGVAAHPRLAGVFAVADAKRKVSVIEVRTGVRLLEFTPEFEELSGSLRLAFSEDGERIAVGLWGATGGIAIHSARDGKRLAGWDAPKVDRLTFSPDRQWILEIEAGGSRIHVWNVADGQLAWSYPPSHPGSGVQGIFTRDSLHVVSVTEGKEELRLVNARDGTFIRAIPRKGKLIRAMAMHFDGTVTVAGDQGEIWRYSLREDRPLAEFRAGDRTINHIAPTPDGKRIVTAVELPDGRQNIRLWDANSGSLLQTLLGGSGEVRGIAVHPISGELLVSGPNARVWNVQTTPEKWATGVGGANARVAFWGADDMAFAPIPGYPSVLQKLQPGVRTALWAPPGNRYRLPTVSADGRFAALAAPNTTDPILFLRNSGQSAEEVAAIKPIRYVDSVRLSPTGDRLAVLADGSKHILLFDTSTGQELTKLERQEMRRFWDVAWLGGGQLLGLVTAREERVNPGSEERVVLWDVATGKILRTTANSSALTVLAVAPDGRRFAEAGVDKRVRIRDASTLAVLQDFRAHDGPITALAWHPTKPILATTSSDLSIRLWNLDTGRRLEELRGPLGTPMSLTFSPSGLLLGCTAPDGSRVLEPKSLNAPPETAKEDGWEDLLASFTPANIASAGQGWKMDAGAFFASGSGRNTLPLAGDYSGVSYRLRIRLRRLTPRDFLYVALPVGERKVGFILDARPRQDSYTALHLVDGKFGLESPGAVSGLQVKDSELHDLEITVRLDAPKAKITATLDAQPFFAWSGLSASLSQHYSNAPTRPGAIALSIQGADWVIYTAKAKRIDE